MATLASRTRNPRDLRAWVDRINAAGGTYHKFDFGDGYVIDGDFDLNSYLPYYHLPEQMSGMRVLDVGTCTGYFATVCAHRGASVTAIDLYPPPQFVNHVADHFGLDITYTQKNIYDLDESFGRFDYVICGSLLLHLFDQVGAMQRLRRVCAGKCVVSTAATWDSRTNPAPLCEFVGKKSPQGEYWETWALSAAAFREMMTVAGFARIDRVEHFVLQSEPGRFPNTIPHVLVEASV